MALFPCNTSGGKAEIHSLRASSTINYNAVFDLSDYDVANYTVNDFHVGLVSWGPFTPNVATQQSLSVSIVSFDSSTKQLIAKAAIQAAYGGSSYTLELTFV